MSKRKFHGYKPNGRPTASLNAYLRAWRGFNRPLCKALGLRVIGFEPDLLVCDAEGKHQSVEIPTWLALRIKTALESQVR